MSSVTFAIGEMSALVDQGRFAEAAQVGNAAQIRLGVDTKSIQYNDRLSHGTQSTVFRGQYLEQCVAIKKAKISKSSDLDNFKLETSMMAELRHVPNVISVLAARLLPPGYMLIMPYIPQNMSVRIHHDGWRPNWPSTLQVALALTTALSATHTAGILHRDLKPGNILLDEANIPYICDFGIAIRTAELEEDDAAGSKQGKPSGGFHKRHMIGTLEYMAPEILQKKHPSDKSDVWALAVTLNELATGVFPYSDCTHENPAAHTVLEMGYGRQELAASIATEGLLPLMKPDTPQPFAALLKACWQLDPLQRPSAAQMLDSLKSMHTAMQPSGTSDETATAEPAQEPASASATFPEEKQLQPVSHNTLHVQDGSPKQMQAEQPDPDNGYRPQVMAGAFATAGLRGADRMEDTHVIQHQLGAQSDCHLLAVFDGHRGPQAAEYAAQHFPATLADELQNQSPAEALSATFVGIDIAFRQQQQQEWKARVQRMGPEAAGKQPWPGCTALAVLIKQSQLYVACAGDCRAVLCRKGQAVALSYDQTANVALERERVTAAGATVQWLVDGWRIGTAGIQVTRSLGDGDLKPAVTAQPEVSQFAVTAEDHFVVLASDGLWDKLSNENAVGLVMDTVKQPVMAAQRLATEALTRGSEDNITVIVAFLKSVDTLESVFKGGKQKHAATPTFYSTRRGRPQGFQQPSADEVSETL